MREAELIRHDGFLDRDLFVLDVDTPEQLPERISLSNPRFACLVAWDAREASDEEAADVARKLLDSGAVYICAWGPEIRAGSSAAS